MRASDEAVGSDNSSAVHSRSFVLRLLHHHSTLTRHYHFCLVQGLVPIESAMLMSPQNPVACA